jgi:hypothetical protein
VSGYNIAVDAFGISKFGLHCMTPARAGTNLPVLGTGSELFTEKLDCSPFSDSIISFIDNLYMNSTGNGIGANCDNT